MSLDAAPAGAPASGAPDPAILRAGRLTVYELFQAQVRRSPEALAIEQGSGRDRIRLSYGALDRRVQHAAGLLLKLGIRRGDRVAVLSENRFEYIELELAAAMIGAIVACQNWRLTPDELRHCLTLVTPKVVFVSARHGAALGRIDHGAAHVVEIEKDYERLIGETDPAAPEPAVDPEDGLVILYTSGTTGLPKGALISHRAEIARMTALRLDIRATEGDGFVAWAPMFHMASTDQMLGALMSGAPVIVVDGMKPRAIVDALERYRLGWLVLMPGAIQPVIEEMQARGAVPKGIRAIGAMADLVPAKQLSEVTALMQAPYYNSFGATETGLPPASGALLAPGEMPTSLSRKKSALCEFRLVDGSGRDVADGEPGEIAIRGPTVFSGYWNAPEVNARDFRGGWFHMGDLFRRNPDGTYDFVDRAKYMIKSGGENIYPAEIERVLLADPRVADAVVVRKKDPAWGEVPVAFIARLDETLSGADIEALCRARLAGYKRPKEVRFVALEALPRSATGKIQRHEIEKWL